jgi:HSP20 family molecular chaperone IbpA
MHQEMRRGLCGSLKTHPLTDIVEREDGLYVFMDMPGVAKQDLRVELDLGELSVIGRSRYPATANEKYFEVEFGNCEYRRTFTLSDEVDAEGITAVLKNGVLEIYIPKARRSIPKQISISGV